MLSEPVDESISSTFAGSGWRARLRITKKSAAARAIASGIPNPTPKAIVCEFFLPLDDDSGRFIGVLVEVEDEIMVVPEEEVGFEVDPAEEKEEEEEFEVDGKAGMTT